MKKTIIAALLSAAFLGACGGGGGGSDDTTADVPATPAQAGTSTGILTDSPVGGVQYTTSGGYSGVTAADGSYAYNPGETVTFKIGAITLGTVTATGTVTPLDLAAASGNKENVATNLLVLLQSLDADGDASNGITINDATKSAAASASAIDLTQAPATFSSSSNSALVAVMNGGGVTKTAPVSEADALAHFKAEFFKQLTGAWTLSNAEGTIAIRFDTSGHYIIGEVGDAGDGGGPGTETGRIDWDPKTGKITSFGTGVDTNGNWGLNETSDTETFKADSTTFTVSDTDGTVTTFERVKNSTTSPIVGMWALDSATGLNTQNFIFYADGKYIMVDPLGDTESNTTNDPSCGGPGVEYGTYAFNPTTGVLSLPAAPSVDTNGCAGLWDDDTNSSEPLTLEFNAEKSTATISGSTVTFYRVSK